MAQVTRDTNIGDLLRIDMGVAPILMGIGMHCLGCPASQGESIAEAAMVHGREALIFTCKGGWRAFSMCWMLVIFTLF